MLKLYSVDRVGKTSFWEDDADPLQYYALPGQPTLAMDNGKPIFKFIKYRNPIDRPGGVKGGGLLVMQAELALPPSDEAEIRRRVDERLRARGFSSAQASNFRLARPVITKAKANVIVVGQDGGFVQKVHVPSQPSLFGNNAVSVGVELNEFGTAIVEAAFKTEGVGLVIVGYELTFAAKLPTAHIVGTWDASAIAHFSQTIEEDTNYFSDDDYEEKIVDTVIKGESQFIEWIVPPDPSGLDPAVYQKMKDSIRESVAKELSEGIKRNVLDTIPPESRDVEKLRERGFEDIKRTVDTTRISSVRVEYKEAMIIPLTETANAPLASFASIRVAGKPLKWEDYAITVDADDPFFKSFSAAFMVNADFADLPISSVIVQVSYKGATGDGRAETYTFRKPEDIDRFEAFLDGGTGEFDYSYVVNYKGESEVYRSPLLKSKSDVSINVGDLGIWKADIDVGDINFEEVSQAQLTCIYKEGGVNLERQFTITEQNRVHKIRDVIFRPREAAWTYKLKYFMKGGREISVKEASAEGEQLYVNDPFSATRDISVRTKGDFDTVIETLFLDFEYEDAANDYRQTKSFAFSKDGKRFEDWSFPVIAEKQGVLKYTGNIVYRDGRPPLVIGEKIVTSNTVLEGEDVLRLEVELVTDLLDWSALKLVMVTLSYKDDRNGITETDSIRLTETAAAPKPWTVNIKNKAKTDYDVAVKFFLKDGSKKDVALNTTDEALVLELPA